MVSACRFAIGTEKMRWIRPLLFHQYNIFYTSEADLTWRMANWTLRKYYSQCHNHSAVLRVVWYLKRTMRPEIRETEVSLPDWGEMEWRWNCFDWCLNSLAVLSLPLPMVWTFCRGEQKCVTERIFRGHNQRVLTWQLRQCQCSHIYLFPDVRESFIIKRHIVHLEDNLPHCLQCQPLVKWYVVVTPSSGTFSIGGAGRISVSVGVWVGNSCSCNKERG